jgi:hypothetical protein
MVRVCSPLPASVQYTGLPFGANKYLPIVLRRYPVKSANGPNAQTFPSELVDLFHVFPPEQRSTLLRFQIRVFYHPRGWRIFQPALWVFCTGTDKYLASPNPSLCFGESLFRANDSCVVPQRLPIGVENSPSHQQSAVVDHGNSVLSDATHLQRAPFSSPPPCFPTHLKTE